MHGQCTGGMEEIGNGFCCLRLFLTDWEAEVQTVYAESDARSAPRRGRRCRRIMYMYTRSSLPRRKESHAVYHARDAWTIPRRSGENVFGIAHVYSPLTDQKKRQVMRYMMKLMLWHLMGGVIGWSKESIACLDAWFIFVWVCIFRLVWGVTLE